ncbi:MAG: Glu-tRNA(Gln) amidotransferase subunit GatE, partial [Candidatus Aenigmarchaeota archaeon]|nr:Glu-tRNA(Gln) amidotransferase subunit GatE [Candidatus Aenigmarchaeota archaeon]
RKLRAVAGELGKVDPAAMFEALRGKDFQYQYFPSNCLIELDEEPPRDMNEKALDITLILSKMLHASIADEIHTMRKIVTDGSNTSAFQRTALVGRNGYLDTSKGKVSIDNISVEEESAGIVEKQNKYAVYRLDRLGIPLVEIGTGPDIKDPEHAQEVAEKIGMLIRSTGKSQRGIGSTRQDVNVSIRGGNRIEIKGVQELGMIKIMIDNEIQRQKNLIQLPKQIGKVKLREPEEVTGIFDDTKCEFIKKIVKRNGTIYGMVLPNMTGLLGKELCSGKTLGRELADYAVSHGVKGMIHSDEDLKKYKIEPDFEEMSILLKRKENDAVMIIAGDEEALRAINAVKDRLAILIKGIVPKETRAANPDGTTRYTRPLPGSGRMYPETDLKPIKVDKKYLKTLKLPETLEAKAKRYKKIIPKDMVGQILRSEYLEFFENNNKKYDATLIANIITSLLKDLRRNGVKTENITDEHLLQVLDMYKKKTIVKEAIPTVLESIAKNPNLNVSQALDKTGIKSMTEKELDKIIDDVFKNNPKLVEEKKMSALMGDVMKVVRGRISGKIVAKKISERLK